MTINPKLWSGRYAWAIITAVVWAWLAMAGAFDPKDVQAVVLLIVGFYFGQREGRTT